MKMQDNQFDDLFRSKLENFESEPSGSVWEGIKYHLGNKKNAKSLVPFMGIAASVLVLVAAGILIIPQKIKTSNQHQAEAKAPKVNHLSNVTIPKIGDDNIAMTAGMEKSNTAHQVKNSIKSSAVSAARHVIPEKSGAKSDLIPPDKTADIPVLVAVAQKQQVINPVVPDESIKLSVKQLPVETDTFAAKPVITATQVPAINTQDEVPVKPRHRIHNMGDLINVVIAKVDKRKDKLIEFSDSDDDESNISGVNLGIIKIKKEK